MPLYMALEMTMGKVHGMASILYDLTVIILLFYVTESTA
jgi:hypothetical protein